MRDRRNDARMTVLSTVRIVFEGATIRGALLDVSGSGAKVCVRGAAQIPERVLLYFPDETVEAAHLRWRDGEDLGFEFLGAG